MLKGGFFKAIYFVCTRVFVAAGGLSLVVVSKGLVAILELLMVAFLEHGL